MNAVFKEIAGHKVDANLFSKLSALQNATLVKPKWRQPEGIQPEPAKGKGNYYMVEAINNTGLGRLRKSKAHYLSGLKNDDESDALMMGRALHAAVLEPETMRVKERQSERSKLGKEANAQAKKEGFYVLKKEDADYINVIKEHVWANRNANRYLLASDGLKEKEYYWSLPLGLGRKSMHLCKAKADLGVPSENVLIDFKFMREESGTFEERVDRHSNNIKYRYNYHRQMAWYLTGAIANGLLTPNAKVIIFLVEKAPIEVFMQPGGQHIFEFELNIETLLKGMEEYKRLLKLYELQIIHGNKIKPKKLELTW